MRRTSNGGVIFACEQIVDRRCQKNLSSLGATRLSTKRNLARARIDARSLLKSARRANANFIAAQRGHGFFKRIAQRSANADAGDDDGAQRVHGVAFADADERNVSMAIHCRG